MDGLKQYLQQSGDSVIKNMFYNGWTHNHYVSSFFVCCPGGTVIMAAVNYPGCFHDSQIADWGKIYEKLGAVFEENGGKCVVDSAFAKNRHNFLVKSSQIAPLDVYKAQLNQEAHINNVGVRVGNESIAIFIPQAK